MTVTMENSAQNKFIASNDWHIADGYRFHILLLPEEDRTWSAIVLNLPGTGSCGDTEEEALKNVEEAIRGSLESYGEGPIPWKVNSELKDIPPGAKQRWIIFDA